MRHCDDYIDDPATPECLRNFLFMHRLPATMKAAYPLTSRYPVIYATTIPRVSGKPKKMPKGERVALTMASRFGDVGITTDLTASSGYQRRVHLNELKDFSEKP